MQKNVSGQRLIVYCYDATTNTPKTGDAANLTAYVSKDYGTVTVLADTSATEMDSTNAKGYYLFDLAQAETNADTLLFSAKSSTANIYVVGSPPTVFTTPPNFSLQSIDSNGRLDVIKLAGTTQTARDIGASVLLSNGTGTGQLKLASGYVAMTWADIAAPTTTVVLSGTTVGVVTLANTLTTYTGNTVQTGDSFARIGANGAGLSNVTLPSGGLANVVAWSVAITGNITGNLSGSVGSVSGAVGSVAGAVGSVAGNVGGNVSGSVGSVVGNVGGNVTGTVAGVTPATTASILSTALTESYAADGSTATLTQLAYMIWALLAERSAAGTTLTAGKLDGTAAMTFTLTPNGTQPTGQTRAT